MLCEKARQWHNRLLLIKRSALWLCAPDVRRHALVVIVFSLAQWFFMRHILANELFNMTTNQRILFFCVSSLVGALLILLH